MYESSPICSSTGEECPYKEALIKAVHKRELAALAIQSEFLAHPESFEELPDKTLPGKNILMLSEHADCAKGDECFVRLSIDPYALNNHEPVALPD